MGIQKTRCLGPRNDHLKLQAKHTFSENGLLHEKILKNAFFNDNDDCELEEAGCECIKVGAQTCNVPYELYDLADLKMILSLESWNSCLSEEERFFLASFLPDMDQETFWLTIKELLDGDVMFFESPLRQFFCFLKGGLFCPRVTHLREGLQWLQRTEHYYFTRQYHEGMRQKFMEMREVWNKCKPNVSAEERIHTWRNKKKEKPALLVDLNTYPDEDLLNKVDRNVKAVSLFKRSKYMNHTSESSTHLEGPVLNTKTTAKGVLKIKPTESLLMQPLPNNFVEPCRRMPKGFLKIKPKYDPADMVKHSLNTGHASSDVMNNYASHIRHPQFSSSLNGHNFGVKPAFLLKAVRDTSTYRNSDFLEDQQREESDIAGFDSFEDSQNFPRKIIMTTGFADVRKDIVPLKGNQKLRNLKKRI